MQQTHDTPSHDVIFMRTHTGRMMAIKPKNGLSLRAKQVLLMVTGYTPLGDLLSLLGEDTHHSLAAVDELLKAGLIEPYKAGEVTARTEWFGKQIGASEPHSSVMR